MIKPEQVADSVVEKALDAFTHASGLGLFPDEDEEWREDLVNGMRAAIAAALNAWPGMELDEAMWSGGTNFIVLPLTQENSDE